MQKCLMVAACAAILALTLPIGLPQEAGGAAEGDKVASEALLKGAKDKFAGKDYENTAMLLKKSIEMFPGNAEAVYLLAQTKEKLGQEDAATELYTRYLKLTEGSGETPERVLAKARADNAGSEDKAMKLLKDKLLRDTKELLLRYGNNLTEGERRELEALVRAMEQNPCNEPIEQPVISRAQVLPKPEDKQEGLPAPDAQRPQAAHKVQLFNGKDLDGWDVQKGWRADNGMVVWEGVPPTIGWVMLASNHPKWDYRHFCVKARARGTFQEMGLSIGWGVHRAGPDRTGSNSIEIEVKDGMFQTTTGGKKGKTTQLTQPIRQIGLWARGPSGRDKDAVAFTDIELVIIEE